MSNKFLGDAILLRAKKVDPPRSGEGRLEDYWSYYKITLLWKILKQQQQQQKLNYN